MVDTPEVYGILSVVAFVTFVTKPLDPISTWLESDKWLIVPELRSPNTGVVMVAGPIGCRGKLRRLPAERELIHRAGSPA